MTDSPYYHSLIHLVLGRRGNWNPFEDSQSFGQMSEDALFDAEFDRIRESPSNSTAVTAVHSLPYPATQITSIQQNSLAAANAVQQQLGNLSMNPSDNSRTHRQAPPVPFSTSRPRADPFKSAPFPLAPKNN